MSTTVTSPINKIYSGIKVVIELAPVVVILYFVLEYPGYITYKVVVLVFVLGCGAVLLSTRKWSSLHDWQMAIRILGVVLLLAALGGLTYRVYRKNWGPVRILVVDFEGNDAAKLKDTVWKTLLPALQGKPDIKILQPSGPLSGPQEITALKEARRRDADLVIWGTRWVDGDAEKLDIHFDVLNPPGRDEQPQSEHLHVEPRIITTDQTTSKLSHFMIEVDVARDVTYLALIAVGVGRRSRGNLDGAIEAFSLAIQNVGEQRQVLRPGESVIKPSSYAITLFTNGRVEPVQPTSLFLQHNSDSLPLSSRNLKPIAANKPTRSSIKVNEKESSLFIEVQ